MEGTLSRHKLGEYTIALEEFRHSTSNETIYYIHGFLGAGMFFRDVVDFLPEYNHVLVDLPGHGNAAMNEETMALNTEHFFDQLITFLYRHNNFDPLNLYGYSMGARVVLHCFLQIPSYIKRLFLEGGNPGIEDKVEAKERAKSDAMLAEHLQRHPTSFYEVWNSNPLFSHSANHPSVLRAQSMVAPSHASQWLLSFSTGRMENMWPNLKNINIPVTLFAGEYDSKFTWIAQKMVEQIPKATFFSIPNSNHRPHLEQPFSIAQKIKTVM